MINSLDEISCTLVGMRQEKYVNDVVECLKTEKIADVKEVWEKLGL